MKKNIIMNIKLSKEADFILSLLPYLFVAIFYYILGFLDNGKLLMYYYIDFFEYFNGSNGFFMITLDYNLVIISIVGVLVFLTLLKMWKYQFYFVWCGFGTTLSCILFLLYYCHSSKDWIKLTYLSNYLFSDKTFLKGIDAYLIVLLISSIIILIWRKNKLLLNNLMDFVFSSFFALSIFQIVFYLYDVPDHLIPYPNKSVRGTIIYAFFIFASAWIFHKLKNCKNKLKWWASSFIIFSIIWWIDDFLSFGFQSRHIFFDYLQYYLIRSDLIFYFILFCFLCCRSPKVDCCRSPKVDPGEK